MAGGNKRGALPLYSKGSRFRTCAVDYNGFAVREMYFVVITELPLTDDLAAMASPINNEDDRFSLGLPEMDEQHIYLYSLFDRLEQSDKVTNNESTALLLAEIERYLLFHFESEEQLMRRYGFAGFAQHQSDHETAGAKLVRFMNDFDSGCLNPAALRIFLTGWLMEHSRISDSAYAEWVKECRKKVEEAISK